MFSTFIPEILLMILYITQHYVSNDSSNQKYLEK